MIYSIPATALQVLRGKVATLSFSNAEKLLTFMKGEEIPFEKINVQVISYDSIEISKRAK